MLKKRVIPILLYKEVGLVKGKNFVNERRVGAVLPCIRVYEKRQVDELIFVDLDARLKNKEPNYEVIIQIAQNCMVPLTVGGGISNLKIIQKLLLCGVDRVLINSASYEDITLIDRAAAEFGSQCIVGGIDAKRNSKESLWDCFHDNGLTKSNIKLLERLKSLEAYGAGEILLSSIDRDGLLSGFDVALTKYVTQRTSLPVIASGGGGLPEHFSEAISLGGADAVAAASIFHFTQYTPLQIKKHLHSLSIPVRMT